MAGDLRALQAFLLEAVEAVDPLALVPEEPRDREELRLRRLALRMARRVASAADALHQALAPEPTPAAESKP